MSRAVAIRLVGDGLPVPCVDGCERRYLDFDAAASTGALEGVPRGERWRLPGAVRASAGVSNSLADVERLLAAVRTVASATRPPVDYAQDAATGDYRPV